MDQNAQDFTDFLQKKRLQTLFAVDDSIQKVSFNLSPEIRIMSYNL